MPRYLQAIDRHPGRRRPAFLSVNCASQIDYFLAYDLSPLSDFQDHVYRRAIPRLLDIFARVGARATFFIVGREALKAHNRSALRRIVEDGHEVGNHSLTHPLNFARYGREARAYELDQAHEAISEATGQEPVGFRAPGYGVEVETLDLLEERGYLYDSSVVPSIFPNCAGVAGHFRPSRGFGRLMIKNLSWSLAPREPYRPDENVAWRRGRRTIWEIPLTVVPGLNFPLGGPLLQRAGMGCFKAAFSAVLRWAPRLVIGYHLMELMTCGRESVDQRLRRLPTLRKPVEFKERFIEACLGHMSEFYEMLPGQEFVARELSCTQGD